MIAHILYKCAGIKQNTLSISTSSLLSEKKLKKTLSLWPFKIYFNGEHKFECQCVTSKSKKKHIQSNKNWKYFAIETY